MKPKLAIAFILLAFTSTAQDLTLYPAILPGVYTANELNLKDNNPLIIGMMPVTKGNFYGEIRYNYDYNNTLAIYGGRSFKFGKEGNHIVTPQLGLLFGEFSGASFQLYYQINHERFEVNYQNQYSFNQDLYSKRFYYNWSDVQLKIKKYWRLGASIQIYDGYGQNYTDGGLLVGYKTPSYFLVLFDFNIHRLSNHYFFLGFQYVITKPKKKKP
jgi:hypothetical protein